ncbi:O-antigen ligase family protein [Brevundimonas fluminis]|uniref:O-antigen ligase family protein n=1 Tax=Brevundimonas fluminis TaxID=2487274 RepID=UPI000F658808|nr:O-antigen ligase family protein [Brevundimonas fluminis]
MSQKAASLSHSWIRQFRRWDKVAVATASLIVVCLLIGGASQRHALRLTAVELAALPLIGLGALRAWDLSAWTRHRFAMSILLAAASIPLVQLVPLPPAFWGALPGREGGILALEIAGLSPGWAPMSVAPDMTWRSFLAFAPAAAVFLGVLLTGSTAHQVYVRVIFLGLLLSFLLSLAQALAGDPAYLWPSTTRGTITGLFANRNHLATLCVVAMPLAAAVIGTASRRRPEKRTAFWTGVAVIAIAVVTIAATRSRAGVALLGPALVFSGLIIWAAAGRARPGPAALGLTGAAGAALALVAAVGLGPILDRFDASAPPEARFERWPTVAEAAQAYLPTGAGFGSFERVYRSVETLEELDATSFNRAHNEYLEIWLEGGWISVGVLIAFLIWFGRRSWAAWRAPPGTAADLARAASAGMLLMLVHSVAEYPFRTVALMAVFAVLAAVLELGARDAPEVGRRRARRIA